jgi:hypothetical protein
LLAQNILFIFSQIYTWKCRWCTCATKAAISDWWILVVFTLNGAT